MAALMLGLQARLTLAFLLLVGVLAGVTAFVLYQRMDEQFRQDFDDRVHSARAAVKARLERDAETLRARVRAISSDSTLRVLSQDLEHGHYDTSPEKQKRLLRDAAELRENAHLDALWILDTAQDGSARVLAAAHRTGMAEPPDSLASFLRRGMRGHVVVTEPVLRHGRPVMVPVLEVGVRSGRLRLVGGQVLGQAVAEDLRAGLVNDMQVTIRGSDSRIVATTFEDHGDSEDPRGYETATVEHRNEGEDEPALRLAVHLSRAPMEHRKAVLVRTTAAAAGAAAVLALLLGSLIARRITRPIHALVQATRQVADGDRTVDLPVGRRDEVGELMDAFAVMISDLDESEERLRRAERVAAWRDIARELAHEIKNPLTPIQMAIETIRRAKAREHPNFDEYFEESTLTILEEVDRLKNIVSEFSQFARMPTPDPHPCDLNELVHQSVLLYREADDNVTLEEHLQEGLGLLQLDADKMTQVVQNLIKNAMQATSAEDGAGQVRVATRRLDGGDVELTIEDNGCGIPEDDLARVFTPYFTSKAGGTGLGLAVVHRIITGHGGRIGVRSKVGEGTRFVIRLPKDPPAPV